MYFLSVSQKPRTILKQVGAGLHIPFRVRPFLSLLFFPLGFMLLVTTIPRITVVYRFVIKLLLTMLTPLPVYIHATRKWNVQCLSLPSLDHSKLMGWPFQTSPNSTKETRRGRKKRKTQFNWAPHSQSRAKCNHLN